MNILFKEPKRTYSDSYSESEYNDMIKRADVQVLRPIGGDMPYVDSSELRRYLGVDDYELGNLFSMFDQYKKFSPANLSEIFDTYIANSNTLEKKELLHEQFPRYRSLSYSSDNDLGVALQYLGSLLRFTVPHTPFYIIDRPSDDLIKTARLLIDRSSGFKARLNNRDYRPNDNFITFDGMPLNWKVAPYAEIACNDMALKALDSNMNLAAEEKLAKWNRVNPVALSSWDYIDSESYYYIVIYNPSLHIVFVWRFVNKKKAHRKLNQ